MTMIFTHKQTAELLSMFCITDTDGVQAVLVAVDIDRWGHSFSYSLQSYSLYYSVPICLSTATTTA